MPLPHGVTSSDPASWMESRGRLSPFTRLSSLQLAGHMLLYQSTLSSKQLNVVAGRQAVLHRSMLQLDCASSQVVR